MQFLTKTAFARTHTLHNSVATQLRWKCGIFRGSKHKAKYTAEIQKPYGSHYGSQGTWKTCDKHDSNKRCRL